MGKSYLLSIDGRNAGPFTKQELTGKFLRGEIEETTQLCAVGGSSWESLSDWRRKVTARKKLVPLIFGISFCLVAAVCGFKFLELDVKILQKQVDEYEQSLPEKIAKIENLVSDKKVEAAIRERGYNLFLKFDRIPELFELDRQRVKRDAYVQNELSKLKSLGEQDKAGLIQQRDVIRAGMVRMHRMRLEYGVGGGLALAFGASMFLIAARIKTVARPGLPGVRSAPPMRDSARRKSFSAYAIGIIVLMFAFWLGLSYRFDANRRSFAMQVDLIILLKKEAQENKALMDFMEARFGKKMNSEEKAESQQAEAKIAKLTAEVEDFERKKWAKGAGALCALGLGIGFLVGASRTKPPERPPRPPPPQANLLSNPPVPPPAPKPATPKEPKALCPACQQKVAFPKQMEGHQIACPTCGAMMTLDDCSETLA